MAEALKAWHRIEGDIHIVYVGELPKEFLEEHYDSIYRELMEIKPLESWSSEGKEYLSYFWPVIAAVRRGGKWSLHLGLSFDSPQDWGLENVSYVLKWFEGALKSRGLNVDLSGVDVEVVSMKRDEVTLMLQVHRELKDEEWSCEKKLSELFKAINLFEESFSGYLDVAEHVSLRFEDYFDIPKHVTTTIDLVDLTELYKNFSKYLAELGLLREGGFELEDVEVSGLYKLMADVHERAEWTLAALADIVDKRSEWSLEQAVKHLFPMMMAARECYSSYTSTYDDFTKRLSKALKARVVKGGVEELISAIDSIPYIEGEELTKLVIDGLLSKSSEELRGAMRARPTILWSLIVKMLSKSDVVSYEVLKGFEELLSRTGAKSFKWRLKDLVEEEPSAPIEILHNISYFKDHIPDTALRDLVEFVGEQAIEYLEGGDYERFTWLLDKLCTLGSRPEAKEDVEVLLNKLWPTFKRRIDDLVEGKGFEEALRVVEHVYDGAATDEACSEFRAMLRDLILALKRAIGEGC